MKPRLRWSTRAKRWQCAALTEAIRQVGGQMAMAKALGIRQSAVSNWLEDGFCPPTRVLQVERLSGISRQRLRPDLFPTDPQADPWLLPSLGGRLGRRHRHPPLASQPAAGASA